MEELAEPTVRKWLSGERNCKSSKYFPRKGVDNEKVFTFFKNRPKEKLLELQRLFGEIADASSPIDVTTHDLDAFCWSLVNQFLDLLGFQRVDIPRTDTSSESTFAEAHQLRSKQDVDISDRTTPAQVHDIPCSLSLIDTTAVSVGRKPSIRSKILPHSDDCCYNCVYWKGNRQTFGAYTTETYGPCLKRNRQEQLSSDLPCKDYKKRQKLFGDW